MAGTRGYLLDDPAGTKLQGKLDVGFPGTSGGLDVGEGGSYKAGNDGTVIVKAFKYDASANSGSRFTEFSDLDASNTFLGDAGDRFYVGSTKKFWGIRFNPATAVVYSGAGEIFQCGYWNGSALTNMDHMVISKDDADSLNDAILKQTTQKEYLVYDDAIDTDWAIADNQTDTIPSTGTALFWAYIQVPASGLSTAPVVSEIRVRGSDYDIITGTSFSVFWGKARLENHERISLSVVKSPGGTATANIDIDSAHKQTVFDFSGAGKNLSFMWQLPEGIDTSNPISLEIGYSCDVADTFDIVLSALKLKESGTVIGSGVTPDYTSTTAIVAATASKFFGNQSLTATKMSIQDMKEDDTISFELERTDATNKFYPMVVSIHYVIWTGGEHV